MVDLRPMANSRLKIIIKDLMFSLSYKEKALHLSGRADVFSLNKKARQLDSKSTRE